MGKVNITITINEETANWARIEAAKQRSSISRMLGEMLESAVPAGACLHAGHAGLFFQKTPACQ
jgi:hypothetical protein